MNNAEMYLFGFKIALVQTLGFWTWVRQMWFHNKIFLGHYLHQPIFIKPQNWRAGRHLRDHIVGLAGVLFFFWNENSEAKIIKSKGYLVIWERVFFKVKCFLDSLNPCRIICKSSRKDSA